MKTTFDRCEDCGAELSYCGPQDLNGEPSLDCLVCKLRDQIAGACKERDKFKADSDRLDFLAELMSNCPDVEFYWTEDAEGIAPPRFTIRLDSVCAEMVTAYSASLRECIDLFQENLKKAEQEPTP